MPVTCDMAWSGWHTLVHGILNFDPSLVGWNCDSLICWESARPRHTMIFGDTHRSIMAMSRSNMSSAWKTHWFDFSWQCMFAAPRAYDTFRELKLPCAKRGIDRIKHEAVTFSLVWYSRGFFTVNSHIPRPFETASTCKLDCLDLRCWLIDYKV